MGFFALFLSALALAMDAFAVSVCKGLAQKKAEWKHALIAGLWFGGFQALMPLIGYLVGSQFKNLVESYTHWITFGLLFLIGANMIREAVMEGDECPADGGMSARSMFPLAVATSIDALAVGVAYAGQEVNIWLAISLIGVVTCGLSMIGVKIGGVFGAKFNQKAQICGGAVLMLLGIKTLLEHFGVL